MLARPLSHPPARPTPLPGASRALLLVHGAALFARTGRPLRARAYTASNSRSITVTHRGERAAPSPSGGERTVVERLGCAVARRSTDARVTRGNGSRRP
jgi:hypothetical protein